VPTILFYTREDRLGDALIKLPSILALRAQAPAFRLTWVAGSGGSAYARALAPLTGDCFEAVHEHASVGVNWVEILKPRLSGRYDIVIASDRALQPTLCLRRVSHAVFIAPMADFLLSDRRPAPGYSRAPLHIQTRLLLELATGAALVPPTALPLPLPLREQAADLLPAGPCYVGFGPGAGGREKCWPLDLYLELAQRQRQHQRVPVFFLGPDERTWLPRLRDALPEARFPEYDGNDKPRGGPPLTVALAARLRAGVANDSGVGHLMAAGGQPLVSLFGRADPGKFAPAIGTRVVLRGAEFGADSVAGIPLSAAAAALEQALGKHDA
jgi:ADP-heptose:LPS heptosyltransferase